MKRIILRFFILNLLLILFLRPLAQAGEPDNYLNVGQPFPEFKLSDVTNYPAKTLSEQDLVGKWHILDFWGEHCVSCLEGFAKTDSFQSCFNSMLQFVLVGYNGHGSNISVRKLYEKYRSKYKFNLAVAYDSQLFAQLGIDCVPTLVWIDNFGIVQAITTGSELNLTNIKLFLEGQPLNLPETVCFHKKRSSRPFDLNRPILINGNGGADSDFIFRSVLTSWSPQNTPGVPKTISAPFKWRGQYVFQISGGSLAELYKLAYSGASFYNPKDSLYQIFYPEPVLELQDPSPFDLHEARHFYCYSFAFPAAEHNPQFIQKQLRQDLQTYFGYQVSVETRPMPYWRVTCDTKIRDQLRRKSKATKPDMAHHYWKKIQEILYPIWTYNQNSPPFIDETGIDFKIEVDMDIIWTDFGEVQLMLEKSGLQLTRSTKNLKVIVIRDIADGTISRSTLKF